MYERNLNPPVDVEWERVCNSVEKLTLKNLAAQVQSYGLDEKVKETILSLEIPNANDFMQEVIWNSNLDFLIKLVSKKTIGEVKEIVIDYLYWRDQTWDC